MSSRQRTTPRFGLWLRSATGLLGSALVLFSPSSWTQDDSDRSARRQAESILATSLVLTDSEAITFGVMSFDPAQFVPLSGDQFGDEDSLERRRSVTTYAFPMRWQLSDDKQQLKAQLKLRLNYLQFERDLVVTNVENDIGNSTQGRNKNAVYGGYLANAWSYEINDAWKIEAEAGAHLLRYKSRVASSTPVVDVNTDALFDGDTNALVGEIKTRAIYRNDNDTLPWEFQSTYSYYRGRTIGSGGLDEVRPDTWTWSNGVVARWHLSPVWDMPNQIRTLVRRIELGGDVVETFNSRSYYELGVGWLFDTEDRFGWLNNLGLSVSLNVGSALSGGSLVLLYNQQY